MGQWNRLKIVLIGFVFASASVAVTPKPVIVTVFAAASLTEAVGQLAAAYEKDSGIAIKTSFASSGMLARQIEAGAPADIFISADMAWMDELEKHKRLVSGSRRPLLLNRLVLVAPADSAIKLKLEPHVRIVSALNGGRLALAEPDTVPAGRYARVAFTSLEVWKDLEPNILRAEDVRAALAWVARGEAPLGVVYATDAKVEPRVRVVDMFPVSSYPPIIYPIAQVIGASRSAAGFAAYLESAAARTVFTKYGFDIP